MRSHFLKIFCRVNISYCFSELNNLKNLSMNRDWIRLQELLTLHWDSILAVSDSFDTLSETVKIEYPHSKRQRWIKQQHWNSFLVTFSTISCSLSLLISFAVSFLSSWFTALFTDVQFYLHELWVSLMWLSKQFCKSLQQK